MISCNGKMDIVRVFQTLHSEFIKIATKGRIKIYFESVRIEAKRNTRCKKITDNYKQNIKNEHIKHF